MKKVVIRERNKTYYRLLHWPIWLWVFFILPGHLTHELFLHGPNRQHGVWLAVVAGLTAWRAWLGRLPGCEFKPYITHYGVHQPNLWYRVVCYTAAWIALLAPFALNAIGLIIASFTGDWILDRLYGWLYYPIALAVATATALDFTPRAKHSTRYEGAERAWFYVAIWTVVPTQLAAWAAWRLAGALGFAGIGLAQARFSVFLACAALFFVLGLRGILPRTARYHAVEGAEPVPAPAE
ncbi:MAG: hypothetical protein ACRD5G_16165 [Candidatus Acidiferrales bacterium]